MGAKINHVNTQKMLARVLIQPYKTRMTEQQIIRALGGNKALADKIGGKLVHGVVNNWKYLGIPWKYRLQVANIAKKEGLELPETFLYEKRIK